MHQQISGKKGEEGERCVSTGEGYWEGKERIEREVRKKVRGQKGKYDHFQLLQRVVAILRKRSKPQVDQLSSALDTALT